MPSGFDICVASEGYAIRLKDGGCTSYWDRLGHVWTIGMGSTGPDITRHTTWTRTQAVDRLQLQWQQARAGVLRASPILGRPELANWLDAITDFAYNLGVGRYQASSLRVYVNRQSWKQALAEFPKWNRACGQVVRGLVIRRAAEQALARTPIAQTLSGSSEHDMNPPPDSTPSVDHTTPSFLQSSVQAPSSSLDSADVLALLKALFHKLLG